MAATTKRRFFLIHLQILQPHPELADEIEKLSALFRSYVRLLREFLIEIAELPEPKSEATESYVRAEFGRKMDALLAEFNITQNQFTALYQKFPELVKNAWDTFYQ